MSRECGCGALSSGCISPQDISSDPKWGDSRFTSASFVGCHSWGQNEKLELPVADALPPLYLKARARLVRALPWLTLEIDGSYLNRYQEAALASWPHRPCSGTCEKVKPSVVLHVQLAV